MCKFFCTAPNHTCDLCNEESRTAYYIAKYHVSPLSPYDEREKSKARNKIFLENSFKNMAAQKYPFAHTVGGGQKIIKRFQKLVLSTAVPQSKIQ